jgi:Protein of unknown function (DUF3800)
MYLMYVDESGDAGLSGSPTTHFVLSGLVVHETRWREFVNLLIAFRKTLRSVYAPPVRDEIHSAEFLKGRIHAVGGAALARHIRLAILRNTLDELAKISFISITNVVINKTGKPLSYDVFAAALGNAISEIREHTHAWKFPRRISQRLWNRQTQLPAQNWRGWCAEWRHLIISLMMASWDMGRAIFLSYELSKIRTAKIRQKRYQSRCAMFVPISCYSASGQTPTFGDREPSTTLIVFNPC